MVPTIPKMYNMWGYKDKNNTQNPLKPQFLDIVDLPDHPDGDQKSWKLFQSIHMVPRIPKRCHMWAYNVKNPIKTPKILQNPCLGHS